MALCLQSSIMTGGGPPALMPVLAFRPRAMVWLWFAPQAVRGQSPAAPALTFVLIFIVVFPFFEVDCDEDRRLARASARTTRTRLDTGFDFQSTGHCLVVLKHHITGLDVGLDFQSASHRLVVLKWHITGFDVCFDFHSCISFL